MRSGEAGAERFGGIRGGRAPHNREGEKARRLAWIARRRGSVSATR